MKINLKTAIDFVIEQNQLPKFFPSKVSNEAESLKIEIDKRDLFYIFNQPQCSIRKKK